MSALDELRRKADEKKAAELQEKLISEQLEATYQSKLLPKMQLFYDTLNETINHLSFLEEPIIAKNYSSRYPQFGDLLQTNYKINTDGRSGLASYDRLMEINLSFVCEGKGDFTYPVISKYLIEHEVSFLQANRLNFDWKFLMPKDGKACANFTVKRNVPVRFRIEVLYELSQLKLTIQNHQNLETYSKDFSPEQLDDHFLDALLNYFLRKDSRLLVKFGELSAEHKTAIKSAIHKNLYNFQQEQAQLLEKIKFEDNPKPQQVTSGKIEFVKNLFSKFHK
ncbi:hypothetical protein [Candidatus Methylobacter oryzae]|uniref:Uncharacterized protein n=1 Tax=Candidatus Methylobacter oryzae TaxID=2497749 RepID=A0ABY3C650_9GAMM|nr:hypothetical protein [Candidatus Methylobacter oryzae]TRW90285.1 hypothetical protein EKO24_019820 [Candidatus Methylobacter oryzae]